MEALYRPDGTEVWAASYDAMQIAVIVPPPSCAVKQFITGFGQYGGIGSASFHPDPNVGVYYVASYTGGHGSNTVFAVDTTTYSISSGFSPSNGAAIGSTAVTRGPTTYLLEVPIYGCCPQYGYTNTFDVSDSNKAHNFEDYLVGAENNSVNMRAVTTLRTVSP